MAVQELRLLLKLVGGEPIVVAVEQRDVSAARSADPAGDDLVAVEVPLR